MPQETKVNSKGETLYRTAGGNAWTTRAPDREVARYTPIEGENAGQRVSLKADGSKSVVQPKGTITSEQARITVENAKKEDKSSGSNSGLASAYSKLFAENQKTKEELAKSQAELTNAQSGLSIADQQKKQIEDEAAEALLKNKKKNSETSTDVAVSEDPMVELAGDDPVLKAMLESSYQKADGIATQLEVLRSQMLDADDDTKFMIRQIENMANQQIRRQEKSNEQMIRGAKVAGLVAGIAQYSPETHSGIVQDTINDGLALIQDIEFKAMEKKYQAKKDLRDFNYKSYLESQKLITEYNDLKNQTIISMYEQIQAAETDARERIKFDNEIADRNAIILAPELINATPDMIAKTAAANGIELGALIRAVNDAKYEQDSRSLDLESKRASIASSNRANQPKPEDEEKPMSFSDLKEASERYNLFDVTKEKGADGEKRQINLVPSHWTRSDFNGFISKYPNIDTFSTQEKKTAIKRYQEGTTDFIGPLQAAHSVTLGTQNLTNL